MSNLKNAILEGVLSAVRSHPGATIGQLGDLDALGFDLRAVPVSRLLGENTPSGITGGSGYGAGVVGIGSTSVSGVYGVIGGGAPANHKLDPANGAKTRTKVQRENFDAAVLWFVAEGKTEAPEDTWLWSAIEIGDALQERGHGNATPEQLRKSFHRLIALKQVKQSGKARGARYTATAKGVKAFEKMGAA